MAEVLCIGDSCADIIIPFDQEERIISCGGAAANTACALGKLNVSTALTAKAGNDLPGIAMKKELERSGVDTSYLILDEDLSSTQIEIRIDENKDRHPVLLNAEDPSYLKIYSEDLKRIDLNDTKYILTNGMMLFRQPAASSILSFLKEAKKKGISILLDINCRPETKDQDRDILMKVITLSDILLGSVEDDFLSLCQTDSLEAAIGMLKRNSQIIVAHDETGSDVFDGKKRYHCDSFRVPVADSIGAGDNFNAGFLYGLIHQMPLEICNKIACLVAAYSLRKEGARNTPGEEELLALMKDEKRLSE